MAIGLATKAASNEPGRSPTVTVNHELLARLTARPEQCPAWGNH
jgi:hypothetical protein